MLTQSREVSGELVGVPRDWRDDLQVSPWLKMFQNAREWCENV